MCSKFRQGQFIRETCGGVNCKLKGEIVINMLTVKNKQKISREEFLDKVREKVSKMTTRVNNEEKKHSENNIFYILGIQDFEIRHSNFLAWLFSDEEEFVRLFLKSICICNLSNEYVDNLSIKQGDFDVFREYNKQTNGRSIDIVLDFKKDKLVIVIENKWKASESDMQLSDYHDAIENSSEFQDYKKVYIYLTQNGISPKSAIDQNNYVSVSYEKILEILTSLNMRNKSKEKAIIINHYIEILKEKKSQEVQIEIHNWMQTWRSKQKSKRDLWW